MPHAEEWVRIRWLSGSFLSLIVALHNPISWNKTSIAARSNPRRATVRNVPFFPVLLIAWSATNIAKRRRKWLNIRIWENTNFISRRGSHNFHKPPFYLPPTPRPVGPLGWSASCDSLASAAGKTCRLSLELPLLDGFAGSPLGCYEQWLILHHFPAEYSLRARREEEEEGGGRAEEGRELHCITVHKCSVVLSQLSLTLHQLLRGLLQSNV